MAVKIAINGFGRIGRLVFKKILESHPDLEVVAINDLTDSKTLAYLLKYDSSYGVYDKEVDFDEKNIKVNGKRFPIFAEKDPSNLPWEDLKVDVVLECTGHFTDFEGARKHLEAGAKKVIISTNSKSPEVAHYVLGVNEDKYDPKKDDVIANGSCTTNCLSPIAKILNDHFKIERGFMTTVHSYTNNQRLLDLPHKDLRRGRAAALSIVPTTTGAAQAVEKVIPELEGKIDGIALRVPTPTVSIVDFVCYVQKKTSREEVNYIFKKVSQEERYKGILGIEDAPLVSVDLKGNSFSAIVDANLTMVEDNLVKVFAWYDNEWGYVSRLAQMAEYIGKLLISSQ